MKQQDERLSSMEESAKKNDERFKNIQDKLTQQEAKSRGGKMKTLLGLGIARTLGGLVGSKTSNAYRPLPPPPPRPNYEYFIPPVAPPPTLPVNNPSISNTITNAPINSSRASNDRRTYYKRTYAPRRYYRKTKVTEVHTRRRRSRK